MLHRYFPGFVATQDDVWDLSSSWEAKLRAEVAEAEESITQLQVLQCGRVSPFSVLMTVHSERLQSTLHQVFSGFARRNKGYIRQVR